MMIHEWLVNEIRTYVKNQEKDKDRQINLFLIKDFIQTCRGFDCTDGEIETATRVIEDERGSKFQRGDAMGATMKIIRHREAIRAKGVMCSTSYVPVDPNRKVN